MGAAPWCLVASTVPCQACDLRAGGAHALATVVLALSGRMGGLSRAQRKPRLPQWLCLQSPALLTPQSPSSGYLPPSLPPHTSHSPPWLMELSEGRRCSQIPFSGPSPCQGRDGTNIDNEIFGTSVLGADPVPTGSPPCPERGQMGSQLLVRTETTGHPPCSRLRGPGCAGTAQTCCSGLRSWLPLCRPLPPTPACW